MTGEPLWRHSGFLRLWIGQTVSELGSSVTALALPLTAALTLHATAPEMGALRAVVSAPQVLFGLLAGICVDRLPRRPLLIGSDLARAVVLAVIPAAALAGTLQMGTLYAAAFVAGVFDTLFAVAYQSFTASVIPRAALVEGNGKLQVTTSAAEITGPGLGGALAQLIGAPLTILADSFSFVVSAAWLATLKVDEPAPARRPRGVRHELGAGWTALYGNALLRATGVASALFGVCFGVQQAVLILYMTVRLHLGAGAIGLIVGAGSAGGILGSLASGPIGGRNLGLTMIGALAVNGIGASLLGLASGGAALPTLVLGQVLIGLSFPLYFVNQTSLRQALVPPRLLGRATAAFATLSWGMIPVGALIGGMLPALIGLQSTLLVGGVGKLGAAACLALSPVRHLRRIPASAQMDAPEPGEA